MDILDLLLHHHEMKYDFELYATEEKALEMRTSFKFVTQESTQPVLITRALPRLLKNFQFHRQVDSSPGGDARSHFRRQSDYVDSEINRILPKFCSFREPLPNSFISSAPRAAAPRSKL